MDSDYGIQSILSDDEQDAWDEIDAPFLERPSSSGLVMPAISSDGSVVSSREIMSKGDGFLNGDFPMPKFAQLWNKSGCLCIEPLCGCDKVREKVEAHLGNMTEKQRGYVVVFEVEPEAAQLAKMAVLRNWKGDEKVFMFLDTKFELSKKMRDGINEVERVELVVLGGEEKKADGDITIDAKPAHGTKRMSADAVSSFLKILFSIGIVFVLFNPQKQTSPSFSASNTTFYGPPQPVTPFKYEIPDSMIFPSCYYLDKPEVHVTAPSHQNSLSIETVFNFLSEGFQRLWNGILSIPSLLSRLLGLDKDVFETNSERTLRKIGLDMDLLVELMDEILEEQTEQSLHDALYVWNKMGSGIAEPLKRLKYDEKTTSANFLSIIKLERRLKVVGEKLATTKREVSAMRDREKGGAREKARGGEIARPREKINSHPIVGARENPDVLNMSPLPTDYMNRMEYRDRQGHGRRGRKRERERGGPRRS